MTQSKLDTPTPVIKVTGDEAQARLPELIAALLAGTAVFIDGPAGETIQLVHLPMVYDRPGEYLIPDPHMPRHPGSAAGLIWLTDDFDEPLEEFKEYME
jgi:hypothetical protein